MDSALLDVIGIAVIGGGALFIAMWLWTTRVEMPRDAERLRVRLYMPRRYAVNQGWQVWEQPGGQAGDPPWSGLLTKWRAHGRVVLAVNGSRSGHDFCGLWMWTSDPDDGKRFWTVLGLLLPRAYRVELSVWPRPGRRARRAELTGDTDADFERRFRVRWDPGETGWTARQLLTPELRAALLSGEAYPQWKLGDRYLSTSSHWMSGEELDAAASALIVVADHLPSSPAGTMG